MKDEQLFEAFNDIDNRYLHEARPKKGRHPRRLWLTLLFSILALLIVMACLFPASNFWNYPYTIEQIDGQFYLTFQDDRWNDWLPGYVFDHAKYWKPQEQEYTFASTSEMREAFLSGNMYQYGGNSLYYMASFGGEKNLIPDLDGLYQPVFPADITHDGSVKWSWYDSYSFPFSCAFSEDCRITLHYDDSRIPANGDGIWTEDGRRIPVTAIYDRNGEIEGIGYILTINDVLCCIQLNSPRQMPTAAWLQSFELQPAQ